MSEVCELAGIVLDTTPVRFTVLEHKNLVRFEMGIVWLNIEVAEAKRVATMINRIANRVEKRNKAEELDK